MIGPCHCLPDPQFPVSLFTHCIQVLHFLSQACSFVLFAALTPSSLRLSMWWRCLPRPSHSVSAYKMPKYVRRQPLIERIKAYLNPYDFLLWLSEEIEANGWDQLEKEWATPIGIALNFIFLIARANSKASTKGYDDVFGEVPRIAWTAWLVRLCLDCRSSRPLTRTGYLHCSLLDPGLHCQCSLHLLAEEALPAIREFRG